MLKILNKHRKFLIALAFIVALVGFKFFSGPRYSDRSENVGKVQTVVAPSEKNVDTLIFGLWTPGQTRAVLAQVESDNEISISSELSGTLESVNVNIGDSVREGQILARFKLTNDLTQISYLNALSNLTATEASTKSNIQSAEIALRNAQAELNQTKSQQGQVNNQSFVSLKTQAKTAETTIEGALTFLDRQLGASPAYERESVFGRSAVGSKNFLLKNRTESAVRELVREFNHLKLQVADNSEFAVKQYAQARIDFAKKVREQLENYNLLIRDSIISSNFTEDNQNTIQTQADSFEPGLDAVISGLTNGIENTKGSNEGNKTAILAAENRVKSAQEQLEIAKSQAEAQLVGAQAQLSSASAATTDLVVRAPISGKVSVKSVNRGEQVSVGASLFTIVNDQASKKVVAFLSRDEWNKVQTASSLTIDINGQKITTEQSFLSARVDPVSQKIRAEFLLPKSADVLVGSFVKVLIPLQAKGGDILPISAIAFEPDGPEVLIVGEDRIAKRQKVTIGDIVADSVQVLNGLKPQAEVVQFRNRAFAGEKIISK